MKKLAAFQGLFALTATTLATVAGAAVVSSNFDVDAIDAVYNADNPSAYSDGNPVHFTLPTSTISFTVTGVRGIVSLNGRGNLNDADGIGAAVAQSSNSGTGTLSGITAPNAGYLVGVFLGATPGAKPGSLVYATTNLASYSPLLQQVFFIGDGLTGDTTGTTQTFIAPTGATDFYLGFSDAPGYNGGPGAYDDNSGSLSGTVTFTTNAPTAPPTSGVPEPTDIALLGLGAVAACLVRRKR